jgi:two-component system alkaline phosphatase synthesis response regulator PhoP
MDHQREAFALVIDDERDQYELTKAMLRLDGYLVVTADNALEGLRLSELYHPFVIISDFSMPDMDGAELLERLKHGGAGNIPVIILSAFAPEYVKQNLRTNYWPEAILPKPVDFDLLLNAVNRHYQQYRRQHRCAAA